MSTQITIIAGPTASGKSALALERAKKTEGVIVNADALQLYAELRILSARPTEPEMDGVPHALFGVLNHETQASAGKWLQLARAEIDAAMVQGQPVYVVGGTGLYLKTLMEGLSPIPEVPEEVDFMSALNRLTGSRRTTGGAPSHAETQTSSGGDNTLHALLAGRDPQMAARLEPGDTQRILRALAVLEHTGKSLAEWQAQPKNAPYPQEYFHVVRIDLPRELLYARCDARFDAMLEAGALEEVRALQALDIPAAHTLGKAVGVPELLRYLAGEWTLEEATKKARQHTRNYAKRQLTWLRNQLRADEVVDLS